MDPIAVSVVHAPSHAWWEIAFQWGGLTSQGLGVAATVAAVIVALRSSQRDEHWRAETQRRQGEVALAIIRSEMSMVGTALLKLRSTLDRVLELPADDALPVTETAGLQIYADALKTPRLWELVDKLPFISGGRSGAVLLGALPQLQGAAKDLHRKEGDERQFMARHLKGYAHLLYWHHLVLCEHPIDREEYPYTEETVF